MGMFDEVLLPCPECGNEIIAQSKGGDCLLEKFNFDSAPTSVLGYLADGEIFQCDKCKTTFRVIPHFEIEKFND